MSKWRSTSWNRLRTSRGFYSNPRASQGAQWQRIRLPVQETWAWSPGQEDPLEEEMATHSRILIWEIPWTKEPGGLQSRGHKESDKHWACTYSTYEIFQIPTVNWTRRPGILLSRAMVSGWDWEEAGSGETVTIGVTQISQICDLHGGRSPRGQPNMRLLLCYEDGSMDILFFSKLPWLLLHYHWIK